MIQSEKQRLVYKINSNKLDRNDYDIRIVYDEAMKKKEVVAMGDNQIFRWIKKLTKNKEQFCPEIIAIIFQNKKQFDKALKKCIINGKNFKRLIGTPAGIKKNVVLFASEDVYNVLKIKLDNSRNEIVELVPSKLEGYKSLTFSSSVPVSLPKGIVVVRDLTTKFKEDIIYITDRDEQGKPLREPIVQEIDDYEIELSASDGFGVCKPSLMERWSYELGYDYVLGGVCIRNSFCKGMVYPFDIDDFIDIYNNGESVITDIWNKEQDLRECELILTESMLKLWDSYDNIKHYIKCCKENDYTFAICKTVEREIEDERNLNYQYLQSYNMSYDDMNKLVMPTVDWIKDAVCGDYNTTMEFLGVDIDEPTEDNFDFVQALIASEKMMNDPFVVNKVNRLIKKKIDEAKIGKLKCRANYQLASGDPFALMQHVLGLEVTGLLNRKEFYSTYWDNNSVDEVLIMRSPMTSHNNIVKGNIKANDDTKKWYKHMYNVLIFNCWDGTMCAENGEDFDGDTNFTTDNEILLKNYVEMRPIICTQSKPNKKVITEDDLAKSNKDGFNNSVGGITNTATGTYDVLSFFEEGSKEYETLMYRILCGQLYQQNSIDSAKGILTTKMPLFWKDKSKCDNDFYKSIVSDRKPYFMIYIYPNEMKTYKNFVDVTNQNALVNFGMTIDELLSKDCYTEDEQSFIDYYNRFFPVTMGNCIMNKICRLVENEFYGFIQERTSGEFDVSILKNNDVTYTRKQYECVKEVYEEYKKQSYEEVADRSGVKLDKDSCLMYRKLFLDNFKEKAMNACKNKDKLCNIVVDLCYSNKNSKQFAWDCCYETIINNIRRNCNDNK